MYPPFRLRGIFEGRLKYEESNQSILTHRDTEWYFHFIADLSALQKLGAVSMGVTQDIDSCGETVGVRTQTAAR